MMRFKLLPLCVLGFFVPSSYAAPLDNAKFTEVLNSVSVIERSTKKTSPARVSQEFRAPNVIRTGPDSRAELIAPDHTVTRVGSNTLFSFVPNTREVDLQKGAILFNSPPGAGGGVIRTPAASAAVLGTTMIVSATANGGLKVLLLEGNGRVTLSNGQSQSIAAGQMSLVQPGQKFGKVMGFKIQEQSAKSRLVKGFKRPLPSLKKINTAMQRQEQDIAEGKLEAGGPPPKGERGEHGDRPPKREQGNQGQPLGRPGPGPHGPGGPGGPGFGPGGVGAGPQDQAVQTMQNQQPPRGGNQQPPRNMPPRQQPQQQQQQPKPPQQQPPPPNGPGTGPGTGPGSGPGTGTGPGSGSPGL